MDDSSFFFLRSRCFHSPRRRGEGKLAFYFIPNSSAFAAAVWLVLFSCVSWCLMLTFFSTVAPVFVALGNIMCSVWRFAHTIQQRHIHTSAFVCDAHTPQTPPIKTRALIQDISHVSCKSIAVNLEYSLTLYRQHLLVHCTFPLPLSSLPWLVLWQKRTHTLLRLYFTFYYPLPLKSTK